MNLDTNTTNNAVPRNPWTSEPLPPLPEVSNPEKWVLGFLDDGTYLIYEDDEGPMSLSYNAYAWENGATECDMIGCTADALYLNGLDETAARLPEWIAEVRAVAQWVHQAFGK